MVQAQITPITRFSRKDVARILRLPVQQIAGWERSGTIPRTEFYGFDDLTHLRRLKELRTMRVSSRSIRKSVAAMQRVAGLANPLREAAAIRSGSRLVFRHSGALFDPVTQQLAFDFEQAGQREVVLSRTGALSRSAAAKAQETFLRAVQMEENPETLDDAAALYEEVLRLNVGHAPACINLGTIFYNRHQFGEAERLYRKATELDPEYALAFFDLGNVLDELRRLPEAVVAYQSAIRILPNYADAHYNLALTYERQGERRRALKHWLMYVRLDPSGPWSSHASGQARRILATEKLSIVSRRGRLAG